MWDHFQFTISQHYLPAIINDDWTGLSDKEANALSGFLMHASTLIPANAKSSHWAVDVEDCTNFARCEVSNLYSDVSDISLMFQV